MRPKKHGEIFILYAVNIILIKTVCVGAFRKRTKGE